MDQEKKIIFGISLLIGVGIIPPLLLLLIPFFLLKQLVKLLAKHVKPDFVEIVSGYSKYLAVQDVYNRPKCTGTTILIFQEGMKVDMDRVEEVASAVLAQKRFAKAKQLLVKWLGFYFWAHNPHFRLKDQFVLHSEPIGEKEVKKLAEETFLEKSFSPSKPLWEIHLFQRIFLEPKTEDSCGNFPPGDEDSNCCPSRERSGAIFIIHHSLADWYSSMDVAEAIRKATKSLPPSSSASNGEDSDDSSAVPDIPASNNNNAKNEQPNGEAVEVKKQKVSEFLLALYFIKAILTGPTEMIYLTLLSYRNGIRNTTGITPTCEHNYFQIRIPDDAITEVARKAGVGTIPLVMTCFAGALRQSLVDLGIQELPEEISTTGPVPVPLRRPKKLDNFYSVMPIQLPIKVADRRVRLERMVESFDSLKRSTAPLAFLGMFEVVGSLFAWIVKLVVSIPLGMVSHTVLPGPNDLSDTLGVGIDEAIFSGAMPYGKVIMLGFFSVRTNGLLHFKVHGDKALFPTETSSKRFLRFFVREIEAFNGGVPIPVS